ncbi:MAG: potassium-transporting ATPase subunit KdpC [Actinobacteria bacterium]|nr:potassium-transporting ATPase subunit KdpC [Actinomycetota bacterium]MCL5446410.1 potassium-transporting ATPase subunit KdpC [Actinomycetota bacterium]
MTSRMLWTSTKLVLLSCVFLGIVYMLAMTGFAEVVFPSQANGSLVHYHGHVVGSKLIGEQFTSAGFFQGRPSATSPAYNAADSSASNLGPTNKLLIGHVKARIQAFLKENPGIKVNQIPPSLVESSDSGLDPDITPADAYVQVPRVARADHLPQATVRKVISENIHGRFLGIFGHSYVNVLEMNLALLRAQSATGVSAGTRTHGISAPATAPGHVDPGADPGARKR